MSGLDSVRADLAEMLDEAEWNWLMPHAQRDVLLVVAPGLSLLDVGVAIASDNVAEVQSWIQQNLLAKPTATQLSDWNSDQEKRFSALIVRPYVLVQELSIPSDTPEVKGSY
ncbi:DUF2288 domain-containing protein [Trichocoleus desertorum AS-A10]|uniref:DUF2288 domain-containing protein n=1 Tax=Trichocoleus desertorum TaxID=1481672 RepID=UPI00329A1F16